MNKEGKRFLKYIGVLVLAVVLAFGLGKLLYIMRPKNVNSEQVASKMTQEILSAKPGAILVALDGQLMHFEFTNGNPNGIVTYNMFGGLHDQMPPVHLARLLARVVNQDEPGYNDLARRYLAGGHVDPHPLPPQ